MRFFSGNGDNGKTSLISGERISKDDPVFDLLGNLDELSANLGMAASFCTDEGIKTDIRTIQQKLSGLMGIIAGRFTKEEAIATELAIALEWIEERIQVYGKDSKHKTGFVFSGRTSAGAALDISRTVSRRAERTAVRTLRLGKDLREKILPVLNRLSSLLFFMYLKVEDI